MIPSRHMAILTGQSELEEAPGSRQQATLRLIPEGAAGVKATLDTMVGLVKRFKIVPEIRAMAEQIIAHVKQKDYAGEIRAIFEWVRDKIRYTQDVRDIETLKTPDALLYSFQGDCDDKALLVATLLESIGYTTRFIAVGFTQPGEFDHVYAEVRLGTVWIALETTENMPLGWKPSNVIASMVRHV